MNADCCQNFQFFLRKGFNFNAKIRRFSSLDFAKMPFVLSRELEEVGSVDVAFGTSDMCRVKHYKLFY